MEPDLIKMKSKEIRKLILSTIVKAKGGHAGASLSEVDILATLYFHVLRISPETLQDPLRDRFILSKGHGSEGLYCTLAAKGILPKSELDRYLTHACDLSIHPTNHVPGVEICTGALGHGFSIAVGIALSAKKKNQSYRAFVLTGDGELEEGSNWEAAMSAAHFKLGNLTVIVDNNQLQLIDFISHTMEIEPLFDKFVSFGFDVHVVDGHSPQDLCRVFDNLDYEGDKPHAIIARTVKGKGISFMENVPEWHHRIPTEVEGDAALMELEA